MRKLSFVTSSSSPSPSSCLESSRTSYRLHRNIVPRVVVDNPSLPWRHRGSALPGPCNLDPERHASPFSHAVRRTGRWSRLPWGAQGIIVALVCAAARPVRPVGYLRACAGRAAWMPDMFVLYVRGGLDTSVRESDAGMSRVSMVMKSWAARTYQAKVSHVPGPGGRPGARVGPLTAMSVSKASCGACVCPEVCAAAAAALESRCARPTSGSMVVMHDDSGEEDTQEIAR